jgi:hypothetical protein
VTEASGTVPEVCEDPDEGNDGTGTYTSDLVWVVDTSCDSNDDCGVLIRAHRTIDDRSITAVALVVGEFADPELLVPMKYETDGDTVEAVAYWKKSMLRNAKIWVVYEMLNGCVLYSSAQLSDGGQ